VEAFSDYDYMNRLNYDIWFTSVQAVTIELEYRRHRAIYIAAHNDSDRLVFLTERRDVLNYLARPGLEYV